MAGFNISEYAFIVNERAEILVQHYINEVKLAGKEVANNRFLKNLADQAYVAAQQASSEFEDLMPYKNQFMSAISKRYHTLLNERGGQMESGINAMKNADKKDMKKYWTTLVEKYWKTAPVQSVKPERKAEAPLDAVTPLAVGDRVKNISTEDEGSVIGFAPSKGETNFDIDINIRWDKPLLEQYPVTEVHPTEIILLTTAPEETFHDREHDESSITAKKSSWLLQSAFKHLTVQASDVPKELIDQIKEIQKNIPKEKLYNKEDEKGWIENGLQQQFHITLLYGVEEDDKEQITNIVKEYVGKGIGASTKAIEYFDKKEDGYSVAVIPIDGKQGLEALHKALKKDVKNKHSYPEYKAHVTIAYLQPGERLEGVNIEPIRKMGS